MAARTALERLRALCLAFPEAHEVEAWGEPTFRVRNKLFAMYASTNTHHGAGRPGVWIKSAAVTQDLLVSKGDFERTPFIGQHGWVTATGKASELPWPTLEGLIEDAWRAVAPKRLLKRLEDD